MKLHAPFLISARLAPALKLGEHAWLSLVGVKDGDVYDLGGYRDRVTFALDTPDFDYETDDLMSGVGGFRSPVEAFDAFLSFLGAAAEARNGGDNSTLFPAHVMVWATEHADDIDIARSAITDEQGAPLEGLIE